MRISHLLAAATASAVLVLGACGDEDPVQAVDDIVGVTEAISKDTSGRVGGIEVRGDSATATVTSRAGGTRHVTLSRRDGRWEVTGIEG